MFNFFKYFWCPCTCCPCSFCKDEYVLIATESSDEELDINNRLINYYSNNYPDSESEPELGSELELSIEMTSSINDCPIERIPAPSPLSRSPSL